KESELNTFDLGYFTRIFWQYDQPISLAGRLYGPLSNIKGKELIVGWGNSSFLAGKFDMSGLPDISETFLVFNLKELITNSRDINALELPGKRKINIPEYFENLKDFRYTGYFTGFFNDFVANGKLSTNLGDVKTDLMIVPDSVNRVSFSGRIKTNEFYIGEIFGEDKMLGDITADAEIRGVYTRDRPIRAKVNGFVKKISFKNYPYRNISVHGTISNKKFNGTLNVDDPNLKLEFKGLLDMGARPRQYVFQANVIDANLFALNISEADPNYHASFLAKANMEGNNMDELNGEVKLLNSLFSKAASQIQVYDLEMIIQNTQELNEIILRSDIVDASVSGNYKLSTLHLSIIDYLSGFFPSLISQRYPAEKLTGNDQININLDFKRTGPFFSFFFPDYSVSPDANLKVTFMTESPGYLKLDMFAPELKFRKNTMKGFVFNVRSEDTILYSTIGSRAFNFNKRIDLENFTMESTVQDDNVQFSTRWLNWDSTLYKGVLSGNVLLAKENRDFTSYRIDLNPSSITISDSVWNLERCMIAYDSTGIDIDNVKLKHGEQYIIADGKLSDQPGDSLHFSFRDFDLANLNFFTKRKDFEFGGNINGNGNMSGFKKNPLFFSSLTIDNLIINGEFLGQCTINSLWNNKRQSLNVDAVAMNGEHITVKLTGDYYPAEMGKMDFKISLDKFRTSIFNPFLAGTFSGIRGMATGDLQLTGVGGKPSLSGRLILEKNAITIDYLNTRYNFTTDMEISNNNILFNNVEFLDKEGNNAVLNGMIRTEYLKDLSLNLSIKTNNLLCLDTRAADNDQFYGVAYATGLIRINGKPASLRFDIEAETGKNTRFFIPLNGDSEVSEFNYINFVRNTDTTDTETEQPESEYKVDLSGIQMNFDLDVTPDAEVQIIFDPQMGDIIKANGSGEMKMSINTLGSFELVGEYAIEKGDYLFTLQDVINKRLKIEQGSNLRWTGDPLNAEVDITAVYRTKASLSDLFGNGESENYQGRVTVDCRIYISGLLMSPKIRYDLYLPYAEESTRNRVNSRINTEEDVSKQFLSLMVLNRFMPDQQFGGQEEPASTSNIAGVNASELLSNQLSNWLSQISNDFDIGVNYRPGSEITDREVEVALSTQLLNDRLSINGSVDMKTNAAAENTNKIVGDFDVDYKINKKGKVRLRAYNRSNDDLLTDYSPYTQGVGVFYMEEFNSFGDLMKRYWATLTGKKKKKTGEQEAGEQ
ncbi:MAG: translocation/assembly module TamB domain-containing protein, partial [Bacteroidales bacterium]